MTKAGKVVGRDEGDFVSDIDDTANAFMCSEGGEAPTAWNEWGGKETLMVSAYIRSRSEMIRPCNTTLAI